MEFSSFKKCQGPEIQLKTLQKLEEIKDITTKCGMGSWS